MSPDGHFIAGLSTSRLKIVLLDSQTQKQCELSNVWSGYPAWSPDGESLFYRTLGDDAAGSAARRAARSLTAVRFGLFYEHQLPRPWTGESEHQLIAPALVQCELAATLGISYVWAGE